LTYAYILTLWNHNLEIKVFMKKLRVDFSGTFWFYLNIIYVETKSKYYTILFYLKVKTMGIKVGNNNRAYKLPIINRRPMSKIFIGDNCVFRSAEYSNLIGVNRKCIIVTHSSDAQLIIGDNCGFSGTVIGAFLKIRIGHNVRCGSNTLITDSDWHNDDYRVGEPVPVEIEDNVWLGLNSIVLKGVTIGRNSIIGANSVVTKNIPENVIAAGNPCKVISHIHSE
jgi:carbonic anhydrase/acetyltransferase-like protein (isoleucine patch superfamily)